MLLTRLIRDEPVFIKSDKMLIDELWFYLSIPWSDAILNRHARHLKELKRRIAAGHNSVIGCLARKCFVQGGISGGNNPVILHVLQELF